METILITGGAGYIGSVLTRKLISLAYKVVVLDSFFYSDIGINDLAGHPALRVVNGDIRDPGSLRQGLDGADHVVHLAAMANDPSAELDLNLTRQINLEIYTVLLEEAARAGIRRFINLSSIGVYGINFNNNVTEQDPLNPLTEYAVCKAKSEAIVRQHNTARFTTVSLRCGTVCGWSPRMRFDLCTNTLTAYAIINKNLTVWGGEQKRPQIHIDDITDFIGQLLVISPGKIGGQIFNAAGNNTTVMEVAETIKEVMNGELTLTNAAARKDERSYHVSSARIAKELGFTTKKNVRDAVVDIIAAYQKGLWKDPDDSLYHNVKRIQAREGD